MGRWAKWWWRSQPSKTHLGTDLPWCRGEKSIDPAHRLPVVVLAWVEPAGKR